MLHALVNSQGVRTDLRPEHRLVFQLSLSLRLLSELLLFG